MSDLLRYDVKKYPGNFTRTDVINYLINKKNYSSYLEIGTERVEKNFNKINCKYKECIDPVPLSNKITYKMTSDEAFEVIKKNNKKYDIIFIDGLHLEEQVDRDIDNSLKVLNTGGTIVLHDCNPLTEFMQRETYEYKGRYPAWNGTVWKSLVKRRCLGDEWVCTVDCDQGCGIIYPSLKNIKIPFKKEYLDYKVFDKNRKLLLNLISVDEFKKIFAN